MEKKRKICIVSFRSLPLFDPAYDREHVIGGAEINLYHLALSLSEREDTEISVLVNAFGQPADYRKDGIRLIRYGGPPTRRSLPARLAGKLADLRRLMTLDADVFLFSTANPMLGKLVLLQRFLRRRKVIFRLSSDLNTDPEYYRKTIGWIGSRLYLFGLRHVNGIVSQTEKQKRLLISKLGLESEIIGNGFPIREDIVTAEKRHILWVGRCMASKRPMLFLDLAARMPDEPFVMIMPINREIPGSEYREREALAHEVRSAAQRLPNVKWIEYVEYREIQTWFDNAKCYVCTSDIEGFPNTFLQSALGGTPILSFTLDPDGMIGRWRMGCVCGDSLERAEEFIREIDNPALQEYRYRMSDYIRRKHDIRVTAQKYLELADRNFEPAHRRIKPAAGLSPLPGAALLSDGRAVPEGEKSTEGVDSVGE